MDSIRQLFSNAGLRCTRQRLKLFVAMRASRHHPTADDLFQRVSGAESGISLATVYNTLEAFCKAGLVQKLPSTGDNGSARYDATDDKHLHMRCVETGRMADLSNELSQKILDQIPEDLVEEVESTVGFKVSQIQIEFVGRYAQR